MVQVFFCKYNDPLYVKMEKLEIMIKLANERNIDQVCLHLISSHSHQNKYVLSYLLNCPNYLTSLQLTD